MPLFSDAGADATEAVAAVVAGLVVLEHRGAHSITWRDGSRIALHTVASPTSCDRSRDCTLLRAARGSDGLWRVFSLADACPGIAAEFKRLCVADWPGLVFYSLRCGYESAGAFTRWLMANQPTHRAAAGLGQAHDARATA